MLHKKFILDTFKLLEDGNHVEFLFKLSDQVTFNLNKKAEVMGKNLVRDEVRKFYSSDHTYDHTFINVWEVDETYTITADLTVINSLDERKYMPWLAIVKVNENKISKIELYTDFESLEIQ